MVDSRFDKDKFGGNKMKKYFTPWGIVIGIMFLIPYVFLEKKWDFLAYFICITIAMVLLAMIISKVVKKVRKQQQ